VIVAEAGVREGCGEAGGRNVVEGRGKRGRPGVLISGGLCDCVAFPRVCFQFSRLINNEAS
jgi:hypothetical protein